MAAVRGAISSLGLSLAVLGQVAVQVYCFPLADCDDVAFGPDGDLFVACHSPNDRLPVVVRGSKTVPDEMDAYVLRVRTRDGKLVFATRIGGSSFDAALRIAVGAIGRFWRPVEPEIVRGRRCVRLPHSGNGSRERLHRIWRWRDGETDGGGFGPQGGPLRRGRDELARLSRPGTRFTARFAAPAICS